jgi:hypothetical protein
MTATFPAARREKVWGWTARPFNRSVHHVGVDLILPQQWQRVSRDA